MSNLEQNEMMEYLSVLVRAQMEGTVPEDIPSGISVDELIDVARRGQISYLVFGALLKLNLEEKNAKELREYMKKSTFQTFTQVCAAKDIEKKLETEGIKFQILKGTVMKQLYPSPEMREMGDIDIIIYEDSLERAQKAVEELGFEFVESVKHHVIYVKKPYLLLEMHWCLLDRGIDHNLYTYYKDYFRGILREGTNYTYEFTKEDFYVYMISHMAKHFYEQGCGIRNLIDIYVYRNQYEKTMDFEKVAQELERCGLTDFEKHMHTLADIWLNQKECSDFYRQLFKYMQDCGVYGKRENGVWGQIAKEDFEDGNQKGRVWRLYYFPTLQYMKEHYSWLERYPFLLPVAWGLRAVRGISDKDRMNRKRNLDKLENSQVEIYRNIYRNLKLDFKK